MESRLDRIIALAEPILARLQSAERLSNILPQARFLAEMNGDTVQVAWLDNEIYGMTRVPFAPKPRRTAEEQAGLKMFGELHQSKDYDTALAPRRPDDDIPPDDMIMTHSIGELELLSIDEQPELKKLIPTARTESDQKALFSAFECHRAMQAVRAAVHEYVSSVWLNAVQEKDNLSLLGLDYRIVVDNLDALQTGVGQELMAALDNLKTPNPANWKLAALGCRNVIIKLGNRLCKMPCTKYFSELDNKELDLVGEKEKNRLYAYIDCHHKRIEEEEYKDMLKQLHSKVWGIYDIGSKGKRAIRHEEAKTIVVDTFEFVAKLDAITGLEPLEKI